METEGSTAAGSGAGQATELQAVSLAVAPDGTVYMIDVHRRVYCRTRLSGDWYPCSMRVAPHAPPPAPAPPVGAP